MPHEFIRTTTSRSCFATACRFGTTLLLEIMSREVLGNVTLMPASIGE